MATVDPRDENCRGYHVNAAGRVDGVELSVLPMPAGRYVCQSVRLIDEDGAAGQTTATINVLDKDRYPVSANVYLAWPWDGNSTTFAEKTLPGNTNYPANHVIINGYPAPASRGPLAIFVGTNAGVIDSDVVAGLGLPNNRHVSYVMTFAERTAEPEPEPEPEPDDGTLEELLMVAQEVRDLLRRLADHLGA